MILRIIIILLAIFIFWGCSDAPPPRGSAQEASVDAHARAESKAESADKALTEAAAAAALSKELERQAVATPTTVLIARAADARVDAAVKLAVAAALEQQSKDAEEYADKKAANARIERQADMDDMAHRSFVTFARYVGMACIGFGTLMGIVVGCYLGWHIGASIVAILWACGYSVVGFAETAPWIIVMVPLGFAAAFGVWLYFHRKDLAVIPALSQMGDAIEGGVAKEVAVAKGAVAKAVAAARRSNWLDRLRDDVRSWFGHVTPAPADPAAKA